MKLRDWITLGAAIVLIAGAFILGMRCQASRSSQGGVLRVRDTVRLREITRDTVIRWYERIVWREVEPETIYIYADTIDPDTIWGQWPEAIIALDYSRGKLGFTSLLPTDTSGVEEGVWRADSQVRQKNRAVLRNYSYRAGEVFSIRTKGEGFHVRSKRPGPGFEVGVGSGVRLTGDTLSARVVPFACALLVYRGLSLGPRIDTRGLHITLAYNWRF